MTFSPNDSLKLLIPHLSPELVPPEVLPRIRKIAESMPPLHLAGFECRLGKEDVQVDFHQGFLTGEQSLTILASCISTQNLLTIEGWDRIYQFCNSLHPSPPLTILEFDIPQDFSDVPVPAVFATLENVRPWKTSCESMLSWTNQAIRLLRNEPLAPTSTANLQNVFKRCPDGARVSHVGIMLSRKPDVIRINVDALQKHQLKSYLGTIGWQGPLDDLTALWTDLLRFVDRIIVSLDVGNQIASRIGLECYINSQQSHHSRWIDFLEDLVVRGLCTSSKRDALLQWSGTIYPTTAAASWPGDVIIDSLLQPPQRFSIFRRDLTHIKLNLEAQKPLTAKGYIRFNHAWAEVFSQNERHNIRKAIQGSNLDEFFSTESPEVWKQILGNELHYHHGFFRDEEEFLTGQRQAVINFYQEIPKAAKVLDAGCGWGGPAVMLKKDRACAVQGITISSAQAEYCRRLHIEVTLSDLDRDSIDGLYDIAFMLEVLEHIREKKALLSKLRRCAARLILSVNCVSDDYDGDRIMFGNSMILCTPAELEQHLRNTGWKVREMRNRRPEAVPTIQYWKKNFDQIYASQQPPGHLAILRNYVDGVSASFNHWCHVFPLIDVIAE